MDEDRLEELIARATQLREHHRSMEEFFTSQGTEYVTWSFPAEADLHEELCDEDLI